MKKAMFYLFDLVITRYALICIFSNLPNFINLSVAQREWSLVSVGFAFAMVLDISVRVLVNLIRYARHAF